MAYNWTNKGSEKHDYQKVLFEYYFEPLKLNKNNLRTIKKQRDKNKEDYEELFNLYQNDDCLPMAFKKKNNVFIKYLMTLAERNKKDPNKIQSAIVMSKVCKCGHCKSDIDCLKLNMEPFIFIAADFANKEILDWLTTEKGIDVNYVDDHDENVLYYSSHLTNLEFIKWLIHEKKVNYTHISSKFRNNLLFKACSFDNLNLVKYLLDELSFDFNYTNRLGQLCIFHCCYAKTFKVLDYLTERFSLDLPNIKDNYDLTIMHNSRSILFLDYVIKKYKFDINQFNPEKQHHLIFYAVSFESTELIDYVIENSNITLYNVDKSKNSILYLSAVILNKYKFTKYLIKKYNIDVNYKNIKGRNILTTAIKNYNYNTSRWIIENTDIDIYQKNKDGYNLISDVIHYFDDEDDDCFRDFKDFIIYLFKFSKFKFKPSYMFDICSDKETPEINIKILDFIINTFKPNMNYFNRRGENLLIIAILFKMDIKFIKYIINLDLINLFHTDNEDKDAFYHCYSHEQGSDIIYLIHVKQNATYIKSNKQLEKIKEMYASLLRTKQEIENMKSSNILEDSGTDLSFEQFNITDQDKINMFDDLLAYTTSLKLQVLTMGGEPISCKNESVDSLI